MKALVFVDHDIVCRHFLMNEAFRPLMQAAEVRFILSDDGGRRIKVDPASLVSGAAIEFVPVEPERVQIWRWALFADQLKRWPGRAEAQVRKLRWRRLGWKAATMLTVAGLPGIEPLFWQWIRKRLSRHPNHALTALLDREKPDVIIHPRGLEGVFINDLVEESRARNIPLVVAMNSWDNPSTKRAVVGQPDWLLVWGEQTRDHAVRFMRMLPEKAISFGAAQFDIFREKPRVDRETFARRHDIDPSAKIILFAGSSARTDEFAALSALEQAIEGGVLPDACVIYRPHPWGEGGRGGERIATAQWRHVRVHEAMRDYVARLVNGPAGMTLPDYRDTNDVLSVIDIVVSPLSTILVEGMLHGKPIVVFAPEGTEGSEILSNRLPQFHFEEFLAVPQVGRASNFEQLITSLQTLIDPVKGPEIGAELRRASTEFVKPFDRPWGERLVDFLQTVVLGAGGRRDADRAAVSGMSVSPRRTMSGITR